MFEAQLLELMAETISQKDQYVQNLRNSIKQHFLQNKQEIALVTASEEAFGEDG